MKRCPDCGFRVKAPEVRTCPLCGVRMLPDPNGQTVQYRTHVHENKKDCMLPNQTWERTDAPHHSVKNKPKARQPKNSEQTNSFKWMLGIMVINLSAVLKSCS